MAEEQLPYADVVTTPDGISLPELKWRELVFVGAVRERDGAWERDPERPMPPFRDPDPFPLGVRWALAGADGGRVRLHRL